jgi:hypothetical protein
MSCLKHRCKARTIFLTLLSAHHVLKGVDRHDNYPVDDREKLDFVCLVRSAPTSDAVYRDCPSGLKCNRGFRYVVVPEVIVNESPDVTAACSLEEGVRFAGVAVQARFRTEEYSIGFTELEKGINVEAGRDGHSGVAPFGD